MTDTIDKTERIMKERTRLFHTVLEWVDVYFHMNRSAYTFENLLGFPVQAIDKYSDRDRLNIWYGVLGGIRAACRIGEELRPPVDFDDNSEEFKVDSKEDLDRINSVIQALKKRFPTVGLELKIEMPKKKRKWKLWEDRDWFVTSFGILAGLRLMLGMDPEAAKQYVLREGKKRSKDFIAQVMYVITFEHERKLYPNTFLL